MSGKDRIAIFPSRANKVLIKTRIISATKGLQLLKKKRDALEFKLRDVQEIRKQYAFNRDEQFREAIFSIAKAHFLSTDFKPTTIIGSDRADAYMRLTFIKTIGLTITRFEPVLRKPESVPHTGLSRGGTQVDVIRDKFQELLKVLIIIASCDYSIKVLKDGIRTTNMRVNGIEYVIVPRLLNTMAYITNELDEMEREEFYRLKKSQAKQNKRKNKDNEKKGKVDGDEVQPTYADATTSIDIYEFNNTPIEIFRKKSTAMQSQTIITGHYPSSDEIISPTYSITSGSISNIIKRSTYSATTFDPTLKRKQQTQVAASPSHQSAIDIPEQSKTQSNPRTSKENDTFGRDQELFKAIPNDFKSLEDAEESKPEIQNLQNVEESKPEVQNLQNVEESKPEVQNLQDVPQPKTETPTLQNTPEDEEELLDMPALEEQLVEITNLRNTLEMEDLSQSEVSELGQSNAQPENSSSAKPKNENDSNQEEPK